MDYSNREPKLCEFLNEMQKLANQADSNARNLLKGEDARMKAAAARDAYLFAISMADNIFND